MAVLLDACCPLCSHCRLAACPCASECANDPLLASESRQQRLAAPSAILRRACGQRWTLLSCCAWHLVDWETSLCIIPLRFLLQAQQPGRAHCGQQLRLLHCQRERVLLAAVREGDRGVQGAGRPVHCIRGELGDQQRQGAAGCLHAVRMAAKAQHCMATLCWRFIGLQADCVRILVALCVCSVSCHVREGSIIVAPATLIALPVCRWRTTRQTTMWTMCSRWRRLASPRSRCCRVYDMDHVTTLCFCCSAGDVQLMVSLQTHFRVQGVSHMLAYLSVHITVINRRCFGTPATRSTSRYSATTAARRWVQRAAESPSSADNVPVCTASVPHASGR